jgi:hypothetical protein
VGAAGVVDDPPDLASQGAADAMLPERSGSQRERRASVGRHSARELSVERRRTNSPGESVPQPRGSGDDHVWVGIRWAQ